MPGALVWESYATDKTPPHPRGRSSFIEPWTAAVLMEGNVEVGHVWLTTLMDAVFVDFTFDDAVNGAMDDAVLPFVVEGFLGYRGHTFAFYRTEGHGMVHLTNLRSGTEWHCYWEEIDEVVATMKKSKDFVAREIR